MARMYVNGLANYGAWQMRKFGNIVPVMKNTPEDELTNSALEELNRLTKWISGEPKPEPLFIRNLPAITQAEKLKRKKWFRKMVYFTRTARSKQNKT